MSWSQIQLMVLRVKYHIHDPTEDYCIKNYYVEKSGSNFNSWLNCVCYPMRRCGGPVDCLTGKVHKAPHLITSNNETIDLYNIERLFD